MRCGEPFVRDEIFLSGYLEQSLLFHSFDVGVPPSNDLKVLRDCLPASLRVSLYASSGRELY